MITGDVGVTTLKLSFIGVCLMGDPVGIGRAHDCPILTVETEHLSNIMDKEKETPEVEKIYEKYVMEVISTYGVRRLLYLLFIEEALIRWQWLFTGWQEDLSRLSSVTSKDIFI